MTGPPSRPTPLDEVRPLGRVQRDAVEDLGEFAPMVQILDAPVPQMVDYVAEALRLLDRPIAEQVIEVPMISCSPCPSRSRVPEPQSAEQLVEVPTVLSPTRIAVQIEEQIVGIPVPLGRGQRRVQGFPPRPSSTAPYSREDAFLSGLWSSPFSLLVRNALLSGLWSRSWTFQCMVVVRLLAEVLMTLSWLSRDRVQHRLVVVFKISSRNRFQRRFLVVNTLMLLLGVHAEVRTCWRPSRLCLRTEFNSSLFWPEFQAKVHRTHLAHARSRIKWLH